MMEMEDSNQVVKRPRIENEAVGKGLHIETSHQQVYHCETVDNIKTFYATGSASFNIITPDAKTAVKDFDEGTEGQDRADETVIPSLDENDVEDEAKQQIVDDAQEGNKGGEEEVEEEDEGEEEEDEKEEIGDEEGIEMLGDAVCQLEDAFVAHEKIMWQPKLILRTDSDAEQEVAMPFRPYEMVNGNLLPSASLRQLLEVSQVSPFGQGNVTKVDPNVRKARHVSADKIVRVAGISMEYILEQVKDRLFPFEQEIECELLKLNIYQEGDFFVPHRDTPLSERSIGSLVIALPCAHAGGALKITHRDDSKEFDFAEDMENSTYVYDSKVRAEKGYYSVSGQSYYPSNDPNNNTLRTGLAKGIVHWVAFYGDCLHEIKQVTKGVRLTLSYQLLRKAPPPAAAIASGAIAASETENEKAETPESTVHLKTSAEVPQYSSSSAPVPTYHASVVTPQKGADAKSDKQKEEERYNKMVLPELKALCRAQGLRVTGKKQELVDRLLSEKTAAQSNVPREFMSDELARAKAHKLVRAWDEVLQSPSFFVDGVRLGFPCFHLYESEEDLPKNQVLNSRLTAEQLRLRGADALLALTAARLGLKVSIVRLAVIDDGGDGVVAAVDTLPTVKNAKSLGSSVWVEDSFRAFGIDTETMDFKSQEVDVDDITWVFGIRGYLNGHISNNDIPLAPVIEAFVSGTGYFGNEAGHGTVYSQCAIVIDVPEAGNEERKRVVQAASTGMPSEALHHTLKGMSKEKEEKLALMRYRSKR